MDARDTAGHVRVPPSRGHDLYLSHRPRHTQGDGHPETGQCFVHITVCHLTHSACCVQSELTVLLAMLACKVFCKVFYVVVVKLCSQQFQGGPECEKIAKIVEKSLVLESPAIVQVLLYEPTCLLLN